MCLSLYRLFREYLYANARSNIISCFIALCQEKTNEELELINCHIYLYSLTPKVMTSILLCRLKFSELGVSDMQVAVEASCPL